MRSSAKTDLPLRLRNQLVKLGHDISIARRKRALSIAEVCEAAGISTATYGRLEKGDPGISLGVLAMVLLALGEQGRLDQLLDMSTDDTGLLLDESRLPKRITRRRPQVEVY